MKPSGITGVIALVLMLGHGSVEASSATFGSGSVRKNFSSPYGTSGGTSLRCGRNLVNLGDHKADVFDLCGDPESVDVRTVILGNTVHFPRRTYDFQEFEEVEVEEWVYNFGSKKFRKLLRFENGLLVQIRSLDRSR